MMGVVERESVVVVVTGEERALRCKDDDDVGRAGNRVTPEFLAGPALHVLPPLCHRIQYPDTWT